MHYKIPEDRNQIMLFSQLELWIDENNPVRLIDLVVEKILSENPDNFMWKGKSNTGCKSYSPSTMIKLLLYCYFNWISGSRRMEKETYRNMELIWLLGNLHPDHWTICQFRRENKQQIKQVAIEFRKFLKASGYIKGEIVAIDGSKMKAYASPEMFSEKSILNRLNKIEEQISKYLNNIEEIDNLEEQLEDQAEQEKKLKQKVEKLQKSKKKLIRINKQLKSSGKKYISPNDPDASLMKGRDGKKACYNIQSGVDEKHKMIVFTEIKTEASDVQMLKPGCDTLKEQLQITPKIIEADSGYYNTKHIYKIEKEKGPQCFVTVKESPSKTKDIKNNIQFKYDAINDEVICPQSKRLRLHCRNVEHSGQLYNTYKCSECDCCPIRDNCTKSKFGRTVKRNINQDWVDQYKARMVTDYAKEKAKERGSIVEHPFGTIKLMMGKHCFILTTKEKVQVEIDLYSTTYNMKRLLNIDKIENLMDKINNYKWKIA